MSNDHRRSEQPVGEPMGDIAKQYKKMFLKRATNTSSVEQRIVDVLLEFSSEQFDANYEASDDKRENSREEAKQQLLSLIAEERLVEVNRVPIAGTERVIRKFVTERKAELQAQIKGVNHE